MASQYLSHSLKTVHRAGLSQHEHIINTSNWQHRAWTFSDRSPPVLTADVLTLLLTTSQLSHSIIMCVATSIYSAFQQCPALLINGELLDKASTIHTHVYKCSFSNIYVVTAGVSTALMVLVWTLTVVCPVRLTLTNTTNTAVVIVDNFTLSADILLMM